MALKKCIQQKLSIVYPISILGVVILEVILQFSIVHIRSFHLIVFKVGGLALTKTTSIGNYNYLLGEECLPTFLYGQFIALVKAF